MTMTVRPAIESPRDAAGDAVVRAVAAARRRLLVVTALQRSAIAVPAGVAAGAALSLAGWAPGWTAAALAVVAAAAAAAWAAAQTPSADSVARTLDTRLGLRDRVAAALQLQQTGGPIATLVARDAAARLASVDVTTLFPLALGRVPATALTVAVALLAWDLSTGTGGTRPPVTVPGASDESADPAEGQRRAPEGSRGRSAERERPDIQPRRTESTSQRRNEERAGGTAPESAALAGTAAPAASRTATDVTGRSTNAAGQDRRSEPAPTAANARGREGQGGSAAGVTPAGPARAGAGGAAAANALAGTAGGDGAAQTSAAALLAARARAEAALGRDVIPPDYRDDVRAYFSALAAARTVPGGAR